MIPQKDFLASLLIAQFPMMIWKLKAIRRQLIQECSQVSNEKEILQRIRGAVESLDFQKMREALNDARVANISGYSIVNEGILEGTKRSGQISLMVAAEALR